MPTLKWVRACGLLSVVVFGFLSVLPPVAFGLPPSQCDRFYGVVSKRAGLVVRQLVAEHGLDIGPGGPDYLSGLFGEILNEYVARGHIRTETLDVIRTKAIEYLSKQGVPGGKAADFAGEWLDQSVGRIDVRFPVVPSQYEIPADVKPHYDLVRAIVASNDWKKLPPSARADPVAHFRTIEAANRRFLVELPPGSTRRPMLEADARRAAEKASAFEAFQKWEQELYLKVSGSLERGFPFGFANHAEYQTFAADLVRAFETGFAKGGKEGIPVSEFSYFLHGSSLTGLSYERKFNGLRRPFGPQSDLDFAIVLPDKTFAEMKRQGFLREEEPGKRSVPYSRETAADVKQMGLDSMLEEMEKRVPVKKISFSFYSESYFKERKKLRPYLALTP